MEVNKMSQERKNSHEAEYHKLEKPNVGEFAVPHGARRIILVREWIDSLTGDQDQEVKETLPYVIAYGWGLGLWPARHVMSYWTGRSGVHDIALEDPQDERVYNRTEDNPLKMEYLRRLSLNDLVVTTCGLIALATQERADRLVSSGEWTRDRSRLWRTVDVLTQRLDIPEYYKWTEILGMPQYAGPFRKLTEADLQGFQS